MDHIVPQEENIREQLATYKNIMYQSPFPMWISDKDGMIIKVNSALCKTLNLEKEQIIGKYNVLKDENLKEQGVISQVKEVFTKNKTANFTMPWYAEKAGDVSFSGGRNLWIEVSIFPVIADNGKLINTVCQWIDVSSRIDAESKLKESQRRLEEAQKLAKLGDFFWEVDTGEISWSDAMYNLLGYDKDDAIDFEKVNEKIHHPEDLERIKKWLTDCIESHDIEQASNEYRLVKKDGSSFWCRSSIIVMREKDKPLKVFGTIQDIDSRKLAKDELIKSKKLLDRTGAIGKIGGWELDVRTNELSWSEETFKIHEVSPDYVPVVKEAINFFHSDDRELLTKALQDAMEKGQPYDLEIRFITAKGKHLWARTICEPEMENGEVIKLIGTFQDITEKKKIEIALSESEEQFRSITEQMNDMIFLTNPEGIINYLSPASKAIFGYEPEEMSGKHFIEFLHEKDIPIAIDAFKNALATQQPTVNLELRMKNKEGKIFHGELSGRFYSNENVSGTLGTIRDISKRKSTEEELEKYRSNLEELVKNRTAELEEKNKELERFNSLFIGREFRIKELKDKIKELETQLKSK